MSKNNPKLPLRPQFIMGPPNFPLLSNGIGSLFPLNFQLSTNQLLSNGIGRGLFSLNESAREPSSVDR
jgi:hypothetical protein